MPHVSHQGYNDSSCVDYLYIQCNIYYASQLLYATPLLVTIIPFESLRKKHSGLVDRNMVAGIDTFLCFYGMDTCRWNRTFQISKADGGGFFAPENMPSQKQTRKDNYCTSQGGFIHTSLTASCLLEILVFQRNKLGPTVIVSSLGSGIKAGENYWLVQRVD